MKSILTSPQSAGKTLNKLVDSYFDYKKTIEVERTKQMLIETQRQVVLKILDSHFSEIRESSKEQHLENMKAIEILGQFLNQNANTLDKDLIKFLTQNVIDLLKTDRVSNKIKTMNLNLEKSLSSNQLASERTIDLDQKIIKI